MKAAPTVFPPADPNLTRRTARPTAPTALAVHADVKNAVTADPGCLPPVIREVLRHDAPIQNTRRFLARSGLVGGQEMSVGDAVLVVLAAANRDPAVNPDAQRFALAHRDRRLFTFGIGAHACPGEALATAIAEAGVAQLIASVLPIDRLVETVTYRPSVNARILLFGAVRE